MSGIHLGALHAHPPADVSRPHHGGPLQRCPAGAKLVVLLLVVFGTAIIPVAWWWWHAVIGAGLFTAAWVGRVHPRAIAWRLVGLAPFVAGAALAAAWHGEAGPGWRAVAVRGGLCVAAVVVFGAVTPFAALPGVLRQVRVPALLVTTLTLMHRYLYVLADEAQRMQRAQASRTLVRPTRWAWRWPADIVGRLFVRASERAERVYLAMCARGWR